MGDTLYKEPPQVIVPKFAFLELDFHDNITYYKKMDLALTKVVDSAKQKEIIYESLADPIMHHWQTSESVLSLKNLVIITLSVVSLMTIIAVIVLAIKV